MVNLKVPQHLSHGPYHLPQAASSSAASSSAASKSAASKSAIIQMLFYRPPSTDPFINRAVAWLDGPFSHVEVGCLPRITSMNSKL